MYLSSVHVCAAFPTNLSKDRGVVDHQVFWCKIPGTIVLAISEVTFPKIVLFIALIYTLPDMITKHSPPFPF